MSSRKANIQALLAKVDAQASKIETEYKNSLHSQAVDHELRIDIKNAFENLRSVLDYLAADVRERYCSAASGSERFYFPILPDKKTFDVRIDQWFPGLRQSAPAVVTALEEVQPFQAGHEWIGQFNRVNNENKHGDLVEQTRVESPRTTVTGQGGGQVSWGPGVTFGGGVSIMGVPVDPRTQFPIPHPSIKVERHLGGLSVRWHRSIGSRTSQAGTRWHWQDRSYDSTVALAGRAG